MVGLAYRGCGAGGSGREMDCGEVVMRKAITELEFWSATGRMPQDDDLERCNCPLAGEIGHWCCGWNTKMNRPQFEVGPRAIQKPE